MLRKDEICFVKYIEMKIHHIYFYIYIKTILKINNIQAVVELCTKPNKK